MVRSLELPSKTVYMPTSEPESDHFLTPLTIDDCEHRVCQLGEACEGGQCARVAGRFCTWAPRDCGQAFTCKENICVDLLTPAATAQPQQDNRLPNL
ncbi:hypothetical protein TELCIR_03748 [Teladorsagia circumcincta]|uniref:Uncharacterized protein n=1 Tax=Teladorsagia circumcincta TaxID=45464 RepID=A0A2G9UVR0_TELCI|nr:hypothetical protein TELCIR_03748 [Teladorsagia circumcincta]